MRYGVNVDGDFDDQNLLDVQRIESESWMVS
jgi:hypothetical protein